MNFHGLKPAYDRDGFVLVQQLLPAVEFAELTQNLDRYIRDVVPRVPPTDAFYDVDAAHPESLRQLHRLNQDAFFEHYRRHPVWTALAEALVGEPVLAAEPEWFNKPPLSTKGTPPHQDNFYFSLVPCNVVTLWMALDPVDGRTPACVMCPVRTGWLHGRMRDPACSVFRRASAIMAPPMRSAKCPPA